MRSFLYMPDRATSLLGQELLCKLHTQITFSPEKQHLCVEILLEHALQPQVLLICQGGPGV